VRELARSARHACARVVQHRGMPTETSSTRDIGGLRRFRGSDAVIAELAGRQHGVVARRQLVELGVREDAIDARLRRKRLHRLHLGVYAVGHDVVSREGRWMAAVLACGPGAVLSHRSAAALWGIRPPSRGRTEVTVPTKSDSRGGIWRHSASLPADEVTVRDGIPVTTVPRTIFDLAATEPVTTVESALRESEYLRLHDRLSLPDFLERYPGRRGSRKVRSCLARRGEASGRTRSPLEERFLPFLRRHGLPIPQLNAWVQAGGRSFQVDCLWENRKQIVELDGYQAHGTKAAFRNDRARDRTLRVAGYSVTRISWNQLKDEPAAIAADLRALLASEP
jgi:very-short-patch-repair endonuclease/predicted transcriptional regulator of viral defense system